MRISQENERFRKEYSEYANNDFDHIGARYHYIKL